MRAKISAVPRVVTACGAAGRGGFGQVSWPSGAGRWYRGDEDLPGACRDRLIYVLDAAPLGCEEKERRAVRAAQRGAKDRSVVLDSLQHLAALADSDDGALRITVTA